MQPFFFGLKRASLHPNKTPGDPLQVMMEVLIEISRHVTSPLHVTSPRRHLPSRSQSGFSPAVRVSGFTESPLRARLRSCIRALRHVLVCVRHSILQVTCLLAHIASCLWPLKPVGALDLHISAPVPAVLIRDVSPLSPDFPFSADYGEVFRLLG
jgi:hypothetical protein